MPIEYLKQATIRTVHWLAARDSFLLRAVPIALGSLGPPYRGAKVVPLEWMTRSPLGQTVDLDPEIQGLSYAPSTGGDLRAQAVDLPAVRFYRFKGGGVCSTSSSVFVEGRLFVESPARLDSRRYNLAAGHVLAHGAKNALVGARSTELVDRGLFLGGNGSFNYYHWLIELLPKMRYASALGPKFDNYPLLVSEQVGRVPAFRDALDCVRGDRGVVLLSDDRMYCVEDLLYITTPNVCPFNFHDGAEMRVSDFGLRLSSVDYLRERFGFFGPRRAEGAGSRLFLARPPGRRNYNQDEIFDLLQPFGFRKIFLEQMGLAEQMAAVRSAEVLVGPSGAAWTNLIFCSQGAKCLCWMPEEAQGFAAFSNLAQAVGATLRYVFYETGSVSTRVLHSRDYFVAAGSIVSGLESLLASSA